MWRKLNSMHMLQTHAPAIFLVIVSILMRFRPFSTVHTKTIWTPFSFDPDFHERYQIDAFSIKTLSDLVRTESLNASKCMRKRKTSTKCKRKRISIFVHCISISRTELQIFSKKKTKYDQSRTYNIRPPSPQKSCITLFLLSLGTTVTPRRSWETSLCKIWGVNNVHFETVTLLISLLFFYWTH